MKAFFQKYKKSILKIALTLLALVAISGLTLLALVLFDVVTISDGIQFNQALFASFKNSALGVLLFLFLQTVLCMLLSFIPGISMAFIVLSTYLYTESWQAFLLSFTSVMLSSAIMYILGRFGGYKLCVKLLGEEDSEKALSLLRNKGTVYFPLMMMFPMFPDDALVMIAGTTKMKLAWFIPSIVLCRGIGIATIVFGISIIPFDTFTGLYDWFVFITVCAFWLIIIFYLAGKLNKLMEKRQNKTE